jgi:hypothetical protein
MSFSRPADLVNGSSLRDLVNRSSLRDLVAYGLVAAAQLSHDYVV